MGENTSTVLTETDSKKVADWLIKRSRIGCWQNSYDEHPRYINLRTQEMFDSLVKLYASAILTQSKHYKRLMDSYPVPTGVPSHVYAARCYISMWFIDLYVSNRKALMELRLLAFNEHYNGELFQVSNEYDHYLTLLNASTRPTYIKHDADNFLYVPVISNSTNVKNSNPFGINNFVPDVDLFRSITCMMKDRDRWHFFPLSSDKMGRPCWLFDWHIGNRVCSWFSQKDNFDHGDVTLAHILGTACTPNLGFRDVDDWQYFDKVNVPENPNPLGYNRVVERRFYGSYEVRTMEIDTKFSLSALAKSTAKRSTRSIEPANDITESGDMLNDPGSMIRSRSLEQAQETDQLIPRFRLTDWVYQCCVASHIDDNSQFRSHRDLLLKDGMLQYF